MESDYVFLCGVMWCGYGQEEAGRELLRATLSRDPDISALAWAMFAKGKLFSGGIGRRALSHQTTLSPRAPLQSGSAGAGGRGTGLQEEELLSAETPDA